VTPGDYRVEFEEPMDFFITLQNQGSDTALDSDIDSTTGRTALLTVESGDELAAVDGGFVFELATITGRAWDDSDEDGIQDEGEVGFADVTVRLMDSTGTSVVDTTATDSNGDYTFENVAAGDYRIEFVAPAERVFTLTDQGSDDTLDSDADPGTGQTAQFSVAWDLDAEHLDAGFISWNGSLSGNVWLDNNADGIRDGGDEPLSSLTVRLLDASLVEVDATQTDSNGDYTFTDLAPGDYYVEVVASPTYLVTLQDQGGDDTLDSDFDPTTERAYVTLNANQDLVDIDAGVFQQGIVSGRAWKDPDGDGIQEMGEESYGGLTIRLLDSLDNEVDSTTTDTSGAYVFNVRPGNYRVEFEQPEYYFITLQNQGSDDALDSDLDATTGRTALLTVESGEEIADVDGGFVYELATISGRLWHDTNQDGIQDGSEDGFANVSVNLLDSTAGIVTSTVTDGNGEYAFEEVAAGEYMIEFVTVDYVYSPHNQGSDDEDSDVNPATSRTHLFEVDWDQDAEHIDGGTYYSLGSMSGRVWNDTDFDGIQDSGEGGQSSVWVYLHNEWGVVASVATDSNGDFDFNLIAPGQYWIEVDPGGQLTFTSKDQGSDDSADSDVEASGVSNLFWIAAGQLFTNLDAGLVA
jgi:serine-aspartate repeat-containing protein C/D/E